MAPMSSSKYPTSLCWVFVFEAETLRFSSVNRGTAERFGYTPSELANMTPPDILPAFDETSLREMLSPLFSGDSPTRISATVLRCKDGTDVPVEVAFQTLTGVSAPQPLVALVCTVAKRRDTEAGLPEQCANPEAQIPERTADLRESERRHGMLLNNLRGMVYRCRNDRDWTMEFVSEGCRELLGVLPDDLVTGKVTLNSLIHPADRERLWSCCQESLSARRPCEAEYGCSTRMARGCG